MRLIKTLSLAVSFGIVAAASAGFIVTKLKQRNPNKTNDVSDSDDKTRDIKTSEEFKSLIYLCDELKDFIDTGIKAYYDYFVLREKMIKYQMLPELRYLPPDLMYMYYTIRKWGNSDNPNFKATIRGMTREEVEGFEYLYLAREQLLDVRLRTDKNTLTLDDLTRIENDLNDIMRISAASQLHMQNLSQFLNNYY